jgi:ribonuclease Z
MLAVTILGNNSALPAFDRHPTAQIVTMEDQIFLIDCGEGTQMQMAKYKIRRSKINHIFISHLHGDHYFGLIGLLTSMGLLGRTQELHIHAPAALQEIIGLQLKVADIHLPYLLQFHSLSQLQPSVAKGIDQSEDTWRSPNEGLPVSNPKSTDQPKVLVREPRFEVSCFPVVHRIECWGFIFREVRPPRRVNPEKARQHDIPASFFDRLKWGESYQRKDGSIVDNESVTEPANKAKSYAYAADTMFDERIAGYFRGVDLLYHETTYLKDLGTQAGRRFHSTTTQAATIGRQAGVHRLLIGHFSSKYEKLQAFEEEAREVFPNTDLALEGVTYKA